MSTIQIRNVPEDVHATLADRAHRSRRSLQEYMLELVIASAKRPTIDELFDEIEGAAGDRGDLGSFEEILEARDEGRR